MKYAPQRRVFNQNSDFCADCWQHPRRRTGSAFPYIEALGHHFVDVVPALVQLHGKQAFFKKLAGIRAEMQATLYLENAQFQPKGSRGTAGGKS